MPSQVPAPLPDVNVPTTPSVPETPSSLCNFPIANFPTPTIPGLPTGIPDPSMFIPSLPKIPTINSVCDLD